MTQQLIRITNFSPYHQLRWVDVAMPLTVAASLPDHCLIDGRYPAVKGRVLGISTQMWHVRADVNGGDELELRDWQPAQHPPFEFSPWVGDAPERSLLRFKVWVDGAWFHEFKMESARLLYGNDACYAYEFKESWGGWHATIYAKFYSGQDAVDIRGQMLWSDLDDPRLKLPDVQVSIETGQWPEAGERLSLYYAKRCGFQGWAPHRWRLWKGALPHGPGIPFRGVMLPSDDAVQPASIVPITFVEQGAESVDASRELHTHAAAQGPLVAAPEWGGQRWLAFGEVPEVDGRSDAEAFKNYLNGAGQLFDPRPLANLGDHGSPGSQPPFGATKGSYALHADPSFLYEMMFSADDYIMRGCHHYEADGSRTTKEIRPDAETWSGGPEVRAGQFGAKVHSNRWDKVGNRNAMMDDQHRGSNYLHATYALTGDELLQSCILDMLATDEMRAKPKRNSYDAPRASGRLLQCWSKALMTCDEGDRARYIAVAEQEFQQNEAHRTVGSPVSFLQIITDPRVIPGRPAVVPWNNALAVMGFLEMASAMERLGDLPRRDYARDFARDIGRQIIEWGTLRHNDGDMTPILSLLWNDGGAANPEGYYVYPRAGAKPPNTDEWDLVTGSRGWFNWFAAAVYVVAMSDDNDPVTERAREILDSFGSPGDLSGREWWALG